MFIVVESLGLLLRFVVESVVVETVFIVETLRLVVVESFLVVIKTLRLFLAVVKSLFGLLVVVKSLWLL